jgi:hypothetical protein
MRRLITGRRAGVLAALVAVLGSGATTASAQAAAKPIAQIRHIAAAPACPSATICVFSQINYQGFEDEISTSLYHSQWLSFSQAGVTFHPESAIDHSNSAVWLLDDQNELAVAICGGANMPVSDFSFGYFFIQYNVPDGCNHSLPSGSP